MSLDMQRNFHIPLSENDLPCSRSQDTKHSSLVDYLAHVIHMQKTVPPLCIAFSNWYGFLWPPRKISGCVSLAPITVVQQGSPNNTLSSKGGHLWKKCVIGAKETHPDILRGGDRNPYQLENAIKSGKTVFCIYHLG